MEKNNQILEAALRYAERGWSVIPVGRDKKPLIDWKQYQTKRASEGTRDEKREIMSCIDATIFIKDSQIYIKEKSVLPAGR